MQQMTTNSPNISTVSNYVPRDDASEAERLVSLGGFGQALYEQDAASFQEDLAGLGLYVNTDGE